MLPNFAASNRTTFELSTHPRSICFEAWKIEGYGQLEAQAFSNLTQLVKFITLLNK